MIRLKRQSAIDIIINQIPSPVLTATAHTDINPMGLDPTSATSSEQLIVTVDPSTFTSSARVAGGMRILSLPKKPSKRKRAGIMHQHQPSIVNVQSHQSRHQQ